MLNNAVTCIYSKQKYIFAYYAKSKKNFCSQNIPSTSVYILYKLDKSKSYLFY